MALAIIFPGVQRGAKFHFFPMTGPNDMLRKFSVRRTFAKTLSLQKQTCYILHT